MEGRGWEVVDRRLREGDSEGERATGVNEMDEYDC